MHDGIPLMGRTWWCRGTVAALIFVAAVATAAAPPEKGRTVPHPRERLFNGNGDEALNVLEPAARWTVLFVPRVGSCTPQEFPVVRALARLTNDFSDLKVTTLIPGGLPRELIDRGVFGDPFPGNILEVPPLRWQQEERIAPRPRIEVWSGCGELLLMRSVPPSVSEEAIYEEVLWARAFTGPSPEEEP